MHNAEQLTKSELAIVNLIDANIDLFADGFTDWDKVRAYAIQRCVEQGYRKNRKNPVADACSANNVHRNFYARSLKSKHK